MFVTITVADRVLTLRWSDSENVVFHLFGVVVTPAHPEVVIFAKFGMSSFRERHFPDHRAVAVLAKQHLLEVALLVLRHVEVHQTVFVVSISLFWNLAIRWLLQEVSLVHHGRAISLVFSH